MGPHIGSQPGAYIVPVLSLNDADAPDEFLGTGSIIQGNYLLTAYHVINKSANVGFVTIDNLKKIYKANLKYGSADFDLALLSIEEYEPPHPILLGDTSAIRFDELVYTYEYSNSENRGGDVYVAPATR